MLKSFLQNKKYEFTIDGLAYLNGVEVFSNEDFYSLVTIKIGDEDTCAEKIWFALIAHYQVNFDREKLKNISFVRCVDKVINLKSKYQMLFKKKMEYLDGFFFIPGFTRFAISEKGIVKSVKTGKILKESIGPYGYPYVNVYDADKGKWRSVATHILLARTFVHNPDPKKKFFVNHKDGIKTNYSIKNLEWVTSLENCTHAVDFGLNKKSIKCIVRDIFTGVINEYPSIGTALSSIGYTRKDCSFVEKINGKIIPVIFGGKYEIKYSTDKSDWYHTPDTIFEKRTSIGPFQMKNISTGVISEFPTIKTMSRSSGVSQSRLETILKDVRNLSINGYAFKTNADIWSESYHELVFHDKRKILASNQETGQILMFDSLRQACISLSADKKTLKARLDSGDTFRSWQIQEMKI